MARYRGIITNGIKFNATVKVRRSIDLRELSDFGLISASAQDLPTAGATHRNLTNSSTSATRGYANLSTIVDSVIVDRQDMGIITSIARDTLGYNDEPYLH